MTTDQCFGRDTSCPTCGQTCFCPECLRSLLDKELVRVLDECIEGLKAHLWHANAESPLEQRIENLIDAMKRNADSLRRSDNDSEDDSGDPSEEDSGDPVEPHQVTRMTPFHLRPKRPC